ncbi:Thiol-disulfide isomerase or thioredoxin [Jannaschia faecimaris]|uniref:Thiol-disulfide isomerase or thioredoxin n=1 Tax=Jannaschia faecimaris TaxID=1244108 RepID=A0A1H3LD23_9RHOB|nr:TlpA disulfide reductase family protein [Jannaschia faecimaris]SDY61838.1 Thiol-disulfide isomerase or thioredoxin [Jannaschia faecimaris]
MLRKLVPTLYGLAFALATPALAEVEPGLFTGTMAKMEPLEAYTPAITTFVGADGQLADLSMYHGQVVVLNFWATWCAPCREEMPSLQALQEAMGDRDLEVVTVAFGRHNPVAMEKFWADTGITSLPLHIDPASEMARGLGVRGLPHTFILDRDGRILAQLIGEADWDAQETLALLEAYLEQ